MSDDVAKAGSDPLVLERLLPARPDRVFDAFVNPTTLARWWGPEGFTAPDIALDVREGGAWRTVLKSADGAAHTVGGVYRIIDRPRRLVMSWAWDNEDGTPGDDSEVDIAFEPAGSGTALRITHRRLTSEAERASHREGWDSSLRDLDRLFS